MSVITSVKIHPAIGIARLGNSPTGFFIGPEKPGAHPRPRTGYKDAQHRVKRQAARFRLYGYDKNGKLVKEITSADAKIEWTVHLVNSKAAAKRFDGLNANAPLRNAAVANRATLIINPGARSVVGPNKTEIFDTGKFLGTTVPLGEIRTDASARLLVLGGFGTSASPANRPLTTFANNDGWQDDVSDGPVNANVTFKRGGKTCKVVGAWVIVGPPRFAPPLDNVTTLYDVLKQVAVDKLGLRLPAKPSFTRDIYPILLRAIHMQWVSGMINEMHAHATLPAVIPSASASARLAIFKKMRDPATPGANPSDPADMPMVHSDFYPADSNQPVTRIQYEILKKWKDGNFINDWTGPPAPSTTITPHGLDRAGLESCVGGAFYPGIEGSWFLRNKYQYSEPYRLDPTNLQPGDITKQMAVPWQADFNDCAQDGELAWWPIQRPDNVFPVAGGPQVPWTRGIVSSRSEMVQKWHRLGFVIKKGAKYVETERNP